MATSKLCCKFPLSLSKGTSTAVKKF